MSCHLTRTTPETHQLIEDNLAETPVYGGWVDSTGPRYCPSIEDKIVRFRDKDSHQVRCPGRLGVSPPELAAAVKPIPTTASHLIERRLQCWRDPLARRTGKRAPQTFGPALGSYFDGGPCSLQVFLEPEGRHSPEVYVQGFSTGLPERLQLALLHTLPGALAARCACHCPPHTTGLLEPCLKQDM